MTGFILIVTLFCGIHYSDEGGRRCEETETKNIRMDRVAEYSDMKYVKCNKVNGYNKETGCDKKAYNRGCRFDMVDGSTVHSALACPRSK